jgi:uncharacterized protein (TIGR03086 family)
MTETLDRLKRAEGVFRGVLAGVTPDQIQLPTPNEAWNVQTVVSHMILGFRWAADHLREGRGSWPPGEDVIGDGDPQQIYAEAADAAIAAFSEPGALERTVNLGGGNQSVESLAVIMIGQLLDHAWDIAKATGQDTNLAPELFEGLIEFFDKAFAQGGRGDFYRERQAAPSDASQADRMAAFLGKRV